LRVTALARAAVDVPLANSTPTSFKLAPDAQRRNERGNDHDGHLR
jgi:hypothetical protein